MHGPPRPHVACVAELTPHGLPMWYPDIGAKMEVGLGSVELDSWGSVGIGGLQKTREGPCQCRHAEGQVCWDECSTVQTRGLGVSWDHHGGPPCTRHLLYSHNITGLVQRRW